MKTVLKDAVNNIIQNGDFSQLGQRWVAQSCKFIDGLAELDGPSASLSQAVAGLDLRVGDKLHLTFVAKAFYGAYGTVSVTNTNESFTFREGDVFEHSFVVTQNAQELTISYGTSNTYQLDDVVLIVEREQCVPTQLLLNGDFSQFGQHWAPIACKFFEGLAELGGPGARLSQTVNGLNFKAGDQLDLKFDAKAFYGGTGTVSVTNTDGSFSFQEGDSFAHTFVIAKDLTEFTIWFTTSNTYQLDNVELWGCGSPA